MTAILLTTSQWLVRLATRSQAEISRLRQITFPLLRLSMNVDEATFINQAVESVAANLEFPTVRVYLTDSEALNTLRLVQSGMTQDEQARQIIDAGSSFASVLQTRHRCSFDEERHRR
ncbi:hypothetical protein HC776_02555 [bacterium]|nr:hypothetical protein [bacterium]